MFKVSVCVGLCCRKPPANHRPGVCFPSWFFMCHWLQAQHGRWQGCVERCLVWPDPHLFHPQPGRGHRERGWALLCKCIRFGSQGRCCKIENIHRMAIECLIHSVKKIKWVKSLKNACSTSSLMVFLRGIYIIFMFQSSFVALFCQMQNVFCPSTCGLYPWELFCCTDWTFALLFGQHFLTEGIKMHFCFGYCTLQLYYLIITNHIKFPISQSPEQDSLL